MNRLVIVPDPALEAAGALLTTKLSVMIAEISADHLPQFLGTHALRCLAWASAEAPGAELILWGMGGTGHVVGWSSSGDSARAQADGGEGLVARVAASQRSATEGAYDLQAAEWTNLERLRGVTISAMAASPVIVFGTTAAVLSRVFYGKDEPVPSPAAPADTASLLGRLIEDRLIRSTLGMESS
ncbi:hypothetical protein OVA24_11240 [Luteolibacter sp. SL250]|uniref:hypothetical protein n=1 Tax=Luteolibacter sp. SL250 TaxID=2995170 RepID=UPI00226D9BA8|nr:hypothetical protein [Luteolibacter sp. SL250]WAC17817.1 hypothetical protein OVA24_11240 [Luteolibacter sp. SL250]